MLRYFMLHIDKEQDPKFFLHSLGSWLPVRQFNGEGRQIYSFNVSVWTIHNLTHHHHHLRRLLRRRRS